MQAMEVRQLQHMEHAKITAANASNTAMKPAAILLAETSAIKMAAGI